MFTEGGRLLGMEPPLEGREAFIAQSDKLRAGPTEYRHIITNVFLQPGATNEHAIASAYGTVVDWASRPPPISIFVEYTFDVVKRGDKWQIAELNVHMPYGL